MNIRPFREIKRKKTKKIKVGKVEVGGDALISVQSMTNTLTTNVDSTIKQINQLEEAGADIVRVSCPDQESSFSLKKIIKKVNVPIVADIHFHYKRAIEAAILVESAINNIKLLEDEDFFNFKISVKSSDVFLATKAYRSLSLVCDYPLHLGITEAGSLTSGSVKSSLGIGMLLSEGIGDTIRVSLSADPVEEVKVGYEILKSLNLRNRGVNIISCPSCARQAFPVIDTVKILEQKLSHIKEPITLSIIGCVVNGPGEASQTQIGLTGGGQDNHMMYLSGLPHHKVASDKIIEEVVHLVEKKSKDLRNN